MQQHSLEDILLSSVESALASVFGSNTMNAVDFYVDKRIALTSPAEYSKSMRKLFGDGANVLLNKIMEGVSKGAGLEAGGFSTLEECVSMARSKLDSRPG